MSKKVKFGIVGIGHIGTRHAQCIINNKDAVLSAVCDIRAKEEWKKDNNNIDYYSKFNDLVAQDLDAVSYTHLTLPTIYSV